MKKLVRSMLAGVVLVLPLALSAGCHEPERRTVTVVEEEEHGEVREVSPGEMQVE
jgi:hypothetical protein